MGSQDMSNSDYEKTFRDDLAHWRSIVPQDSLSLFDVIVLNVWDKEFDLTTVEGSEEYGSNETLLQLQDILSGLISNCPLVNMENELQLQSPAEDNCAFGNRYPAIPQDVDSTKELRAYAETRKLPIGIHIHAVDPLTLLMMVGAIIGFIFSFLLSKSTLLFKLCLAREIVTYTPSTKVLRACTIPAMAEKLAEKQTISFANFEERSCSLFWLTWAFRLPHSF